MFRGALRSLRILRIGRIGFAFYLCINKVTEGLQLQVYARIKSHCDDLRTPCFLSQEAWLLSRERELKEEVRRGRDKEIELAIQRLEEETRGAREECERACDNRCVSLSCLCDLKCL